MQQVLNQAENTAFGLKAAAVAVLVLTLPSLIPFSELEGPATILLIAAAVTTAAALFGFSALVRVQGARLLLAWRQDIGQRPPAA
jgi:hypothetical protein